MNKIVNFFKALLSGESDTSSKRFAGLISLVTAIIIAIIGTIKNNGNCPEFIYNGLLLYSASALGLTMVENIFKKKDKE